jgi:hypothetical protein
VLEDVQDLTDPTDLADLECLLHGDLPSSVRLTAITASRPVEVTERPSLDWSLAVRLCRLTRAETEFYVRAKLTAAGRNEATFTPRAITRLHAASSGVPRGLDRLSSLALMAGAVRGLEVVPAEGVDEVIRECMDPPWGEDPSATHRTRGQVA